MKFTSTFVLCAGENKSSANDGIPRNRGNGKIAIMCGKYLIGVTTDDAVAEGGRDVKPLCIDLCCGIGGWADGFLAAGYRIIGFDIHRFRKGYPGDFVLQDIRTLDGRQFQDAVVIVASPPCNEFSRAGLPWCKRWPDPPSVELVEHCWRIGREANVPIVLENVKTAQRWLGPSVANFGSFHLWGDVPLLRPQMRFYKGSTWSKFSPTGKMQEWRGQEGHRAPHIRAKIPFDLAYWLAQEFLRMRVSA